MTTTPTEYDSYGLPADTAPAGIVCGNHPRGIEPRIRHASPAAVRACHVAGAALAAEAAAEIHAEAVMSWVCSGGSPADASRYAAVIAAGGTWDGGLGDSPMTGETCEHGLDAGLCAGPGHYPPD